MKITNAHEIMYFWLEGTANPRISRRHEEVNRQDLSDFSSNRLTSSNHLRKEKNPIIEHSKNQI